MSNSRTLATIVSAGGVLADGVINAAEIGNITLPTGGDIVGTTSTQTIAGKTIAFASNTLTGVQPSLVSGTNVKTINNGSLLGSGDVAVQPTLVSGTNVKTVNSTSLLGSGDVAVQPTLVSGTNVKTVNSTSLLGSGDIAVQPTLVSGTSIKTINSTSLLGSGDVAVQPTLVSGTSIKTINSGSLLGSGNIDVGDVTLTGTQTLTNKTITNLVFDGSTTEDVYVLAGTAIVPANGTIQTKTLSANTTFTESLTTGQSVTLMIDDDTAYTVTWPTTTWKTDNGAAPTLNTTGYTVVVLWKVATTLYGARVGNA